MNSFFDDFKVKDLLFEWEHLDGKTLLVKTIRTEDGSIHILNIKPVKGGA